MVDKIGSLHRKLVRDAIGSGNWPSSPGKSTGGYQDFEKPR